MEMVVLVTNKLTCEYDVRFSSFHSCVWAHTAPGNFFVNKLPDWWGIEMFWSFLGWLRWPVSRLLGFFSRKVELTGESEHVLGTVISADVFVITAGGRLCQQRLIGRSQACYLLPYRAQGRHSGRWSSSGNSLMVQWLGHCIFTVRAQVQSLVRGLLRRVQQK